MLSQFRRIYSKFERSAVPARLNLFQTTSKMFMSTDDSVISEQIKNLRNIGISAHIDSGKTTLTERILFYTGRIKAIHEVRGKDGVGAKMDSMELEREKGITIQSAATYATWKDYNINIIDTPGHVDFTVEVERALRVLDGAILVLCGVSGVQSQSITVDRQMKRYSVPRMAFINKLDRQGANPWKVIEGLRGELRHNAAAIQIPIGAEENLDGVVDLIKMESLRFSGDNGETITKGEVPENLKEFAEEKRMEMFERLADADEEIGEMFLMEEMPTPEQFAAGVRRATIAQKFTPVFMGSAYKNRGVQPMLDGVVSYLPAPYEVKNEGLDVSDVKKEKVMPLATNPDKPLVALAFKLDEGKYGQLTYMRVYQGRFNRGDTIMNTATKKRLKVPRTVRMHSNEMEEIQGAEAGEILAMFGVDCSSGDTFTDGSLISCESMFVPKPVISLSIAPKDTSCSRFGKALQRFQKEDPTFRVHVDDHSKETIISGMGELHLQIYVERMARELFLKFYPVKSHSNVEVLSNTFVNIVNRMENKPSMAALQGFLLQYKTSPDDAIEHATHGGLVQLTTKTNTNNNHNHNNDEGNKELIDEESSLLNSSAKPRRPVRKLSASDVDRMIFNPQPDWDKNL